jgi:hypothetical protein
MHKHLDTDIFSQKSRYTTKHYTHAHVALVIRGRKILAIGQNRVCRKGNKHTIHAEADAIRALGDISKLRGATLFVIRISATGLLNSKPCPSCQCLLDKCMREYGLRGYYHS